MNHLWGLGPDGRSGGQVPWLDRPYAAIDAYVDGLGAAAEPELRERLVHWMRYGFLVLPGAIEVDLVDELVADVDAVFARRAGQDALVTVEGAGTKPAREHTDEALRHPHLRVQDIHNLTDAGKRVGLHPTIVGMLGHLFREPTVMVQSLTFNHGTEQHPHQDFPFVVMQVLAHLVGAWVALEDVHADAGPVGYWPGSHHLDAFDWGGGSPVLDASSVHDELDYADHLTAACSEAQLSEGTTPFLARKGDVLLWHAALVHRGTATTDRSRTRRSFVCHYSTAATYTRDRRDPTVEPTRIRIGDGEVFADPRRPHLEGSLRSGADR